MILKMPKNNCFKTKLILSALAFTTLISSCAVGGLTSDYNKLTAKEKQRVVKSFGDIDQLKADNTIYLVEVQQVKDYCNKHQQVVIYDYTPNCGSSACMQVNDFVDMCKANGTNPLVLGNSFWGLADTRKLGIPLLMIDPQPLGTKWRSRYIRLFFNELIDSNSPNPPEELYFSFQNGKYIGNFRSCKEALEALNIKDVKTLQKQ